MSTESFLRSLKDRYPTSLPPFRSFRHAEVHIRTAHREPDRQTDFRVAEPCLREEERTIVLRRRCSFSNGEPEPYFTRRASVQSFRRPDFGSGQTRRGNAAARRLPHRYDAWR